MRRQRVLRKSVLLACLSLVAPVSTGQIPIKIAEEIPSLAADGGRASVIGNTAVAAVRHETDSLEARVEAQTRADAMLVAMFRNNSAEVQRLRGELPPGMPLAACPASSYGAALGGVVAMYSSPELWHTRRRSGMTVLHRDLGGVATDFRNTLSNGLLPAPGGELAIDVTGAAAWLAFGLARVENNADPALRRAALREARQQSSQRARATLVSIMRGESPPDSVYPSPRMAELAGRLCEHRSEMRNQMIDDLAGLVRGEGLRLAQQIERGENTGVNPLTGEMLDGRWVFTILVRTVPEGAARRQIQRQLSNANPLGG